MTQELNGESRSSVARRRVQWAARGAVHRVRPSGLKERLRSRLETSLDRDELLRVRAERGNDAATPLVSIRIATYSAGNAINRALDSCLAQSYPNTEVIVVGDCCDERTSAAVRGYENDPRVRFVNLGRRGQYPPPGPELWQVAGATPMNVGSLLARGDWIAPCDDDDEFTVDHVEVLIDQALKSRSEMVWSDAEMQQRDGSWRPTPGPPLRHGRISHGSVVFRSDLRFMMLNRRSYLMNQPADWNLWQRMERAGVQITHLPKVTYRHYLNPGNGSPNL